MKFKTTKYNNNSNKGFSKFLISTILLIGFVQVSDASILNLDKTTLPDQINKMILIDASNLSSCQKNSVINAKCIPANTFQSEQNELASFYHITWVFGTAGINGSEEVLVFADTKNQRDALLALLYLSGQKKSWRWNNTKSDLQKLLGKGKGQTRSIIRSKYYTAKMRDEFLVIPKELESLKKQGWELSTDELLNTKFTVVTGKKPLKALARFTQFLMLKTANQLLKLMIPIPTSQPTTVKSTS